MSYGRKLCQFRVNLTSSESNIWLTFAFDSSASSHVNYAKRYNRFVFKSIKLIFKLLVR